MAAVDPLARFWRHAVTVQRFVRRSAGGGAAVYADPEVEHGWVSDGTKVVAGPDGTQLVSSAQIAFPASTAYIPLESVITLPPQFAAPGTVRTSEVIATARADGAGLPTPDHLTIMLE